MSENRCGYPRYRAGTFSTLPNALSKELATRNVRACGILVLIALLRWAKKDGTLKAMSRVEIAGYSSLEYNQVRDGMADLRKKGVIEPVKVRMPDGSLAYDRSRRGHVARYRIAKDIWRLVDMDDDFTVPDEGTPDWIRDYLSS